MIKRLFCLLVVAMMVAATLPATVLASSKEAVTVRNEGLSVSGNPNSHLPIGSNYELRVVEENNKNVVMQFTDKNGNKEIIYGNLSSDSRNYITWCGLTITRNSNLDAWISGQYCTFNVVDDDSNTTVSSNNITMTYISERYKIKKNNSFTVHFSIVDYNTEVDQVDKSTVKPYLTGFNSNGAFVLDDNSIDDPDKSKIVVDPVFDHNSGKFAVNVELPLRYTGTGSTLSFTIAYRNEQGTLRTLDCSTTIPRTEEYKADNDKDDDDDKKDSDSPIPYIIVDSYSYGDGSVTAGDEFTLKLMLRNTSKTNSLENIVMNVSPMGVFSMASSSNTFFISKLQAGSMMEHSITLNAGLTKVTDDKDANSVDIKFTYQYAGADVKKLESGTSSEKITLPVNFPDRFELGIPESDDTAYIGEDFSVSVPMVNKGRSGVYNLTAFVRGDGIKNPGQTQYIGNLNAGTESSADFSLQYLEPGDYSGEIVVTYEDANMNPKELVSVFNVTVEEMGGGEPMEPEWPDGVNPNEPSEPANTEPENDPVRPVKIVVGIIVGAMSAFMTIQKAKAKRSIYLDEDL